MATYCSKSEPKQLLQRSHHREETIISRLDDLPDHILPHILSSLDIKSAVRTSALSRRWRNAWKDGISALPLSRISLGATTSSQFIESVSNILRSLSSHHDRSTVTTIDFEIFSDDLFDSVMEYAGGRGLQDLSITLVAGHSLSQTAGSVVAHRHGQSLKTLRVESLPFATVCDVVASYGFNRLTTLELRGCSFDDNKLVSVEKMPSLKCLKLLDCRSYRPVTVSGPQLLDLEVRLRDVVSLKLVEAIVPKLRSFGFSGCYLTDLKPVSLPSLDHASIRLVWIEPGCYDTRRIRELDGAFLNFVSCLRNAKSLDLCFDARSGNSKQREVLKGILVATKSLILDEASPFTRLKTLRIQYPHESPSENDQVLIRYHREGSNGVEKTMSKLRYIY